MAARSYSEFADRKATAPKGKAPSPGLKAGKRAGMTEKSAAWPGLPGKPQPTSRDGGAPKRGRMGPFSLNAKGL